MTRKGMTPPRRARAERVAAMKAEGKSFSAIAAELGIAKSLAHADYHKWCYENRGTIARDFMGELQAQYRDLSRLAALAVKDEPTLANMRTAAQVMETAARAHGVFEPDLPEVELGHEPGAEFVELVESIRDMCAEAPEPPEDGYD